jgi:hypothetical protein
MCSYIHLNCFNVHRQCSIQLTNGIITKSSLELGIYCALCISHSSVPDYCPSCVSQCSNFIGTTQAANHQTVAAEIRVQSRTILYGICGEQSGAFLRFPLPTVLQSSIPLLIFHGRYIILETDGVVQQRTGKVQQCVLVWNFQC